MTTRLSEIKLEGNELQTYLETFNKDLEGNGQQTITLIQTAGDNEADDDDEEGTYFVDQSGNYYYQATKDSEPVLAEPPDGDNIQFIVEEEDENSIENADSLGNELITGEVINANVSKTRKTNIGTKLEPNNYDGTVFDAQVENNDNEVSYVYIMDDKDADGDDATQEMVETAEEKVYEFDEDEEEVSKTTFIYSVDSLKFFTNLNLFLHSGRGR